MSVDRYRGFVFNPADLAEDVDLDVERRKEVLFAEAHLGRWTHFEALGLPWNASADQAKVAYLERVKVFHPDRYAGKRLGSYRGRLERIFRRVTEARDLLVDEARRAAYARETAPATEKAKQAARAIEDERRAQERRARLNRANPLLARAGRVAELMARGREAMAAGRFQQALNDFQLVASLDPAQAEAANQAAEARKRLSGARAGDLVDKGQACEVMGNLHQAMGFYREALEADPGHLRAATLAVKAAVQLGDAGAARELAEGAVRAAPRSGAAHEALGVALEAAGQKAEAKKALERALELDPRLEGARDRLKKLKGLLGFLR